MFSNNLLDMIPPSDWAAVIAVSFWAGNCLATANIQHSKASSCSQRACHITNCYAQPLCSIYNAGDTIPTSFHCWADLMCMCGQELMQGDWQKSFEPGQRLQARIMYVDATSKRVCLTLLPHLVAGQSAPSLPKGNTLFQVCHSSLP